MNIKKNIPNTITLGNLMCGCLAISKAFEGDLVSAAFFVGVALVLDFFDGFTARLLKVSSPIGKDLDSLADMVTFGVVPGVVVYKLIVLSMLKPILDSPPENIGWTIYPALTAESTNSVLPYFGFVITIFSCIRLAKFNNDTRQTGSFIGLPTPANAMVICSIPLIMTFQPELLVVNTIIQHVGFLIGLTAFMSYMLVAEIPLFALKFKSFAWSQNRQVYLFLISAVILLFSLKFIGIALVVLFYVLLSIVNNIFSKAKV